MEKFHQKINILKAVFKSNSYRQKFIDLCIKIFVGKLFA